MREILVLFLWFVAALVGAYKLGYADGAEESQYAPRPTLRLGRGRWYGPVGREN